MHERAYEKNIKTKMKKNESANIFFLSFPSSNEIHKKFTRKQFIHKKSSF